MTRIAARTVPGLTRPASVPEGSVVTVLRVPPEAAGMRLDRFVQTQLRRTSRTRTQVIVARGAFNQAGGALRSNHRVKAEELVLLWRPPWDDVAPDVELPILFDDDDLCAIDKPAGTPVHPTARYHASTVVKLLEQARPDERLTLAHRLDRETSGVLLLAKNAFADRTVKKAFEDRSAVEKHYLAIVWGDPPEDAFRVELPLELDPHHPTRLKMRVAAPGTGLEARTSFTVLDRRRSRVDGRRYARLRCRLETGRQHQIRLHLSASGLPIVGDKLYGPDDGLFARGADGELTEEDRARLELDRHALHAESLELDHPRTGARLVLRAPCPPDLAAFWDGLGP